MSAIDLVQKSLAPFALGVFVLFPPEALPLSGRYSLLESESEDGRQKLHKAMEGRRPGGPPPGMGRGPGGGGPGGPGRAGGGAERLRDLVEAPRVMTVTHTPTEIAVMEEDGRLRTLHPDGKAYKAEAGAVELKTRWDGARLLIETRPGRGGKLTEAWSLDPASGKLTIDTTLEIPSQSPVTIRSVYQREAEP